ncbi:lasso peptide biosynthesis B2 protein [Streptomyces genisteinicus]|uniref:Lasso peptide biosynthesis B2 protein n=1 Tax=Streptomyces genisteinicus TaxID=2768068 RepID=A0A7H0I2Q7_9ACTN|nr:lasso peptide biosynthesis B2 protein [Streptomyces genisteinicus]QNP67073.1 lasso peptide biosynthesis B2 protein [Streptomyces genisteinicus]
MTQMIHAPAQPPRRLRLFAACAMLLALSIRLLPSAWRMRTRLVFARSVRRLPAAGLPLVEDMYQAVVACQPLWWRGQIDCKDRSFATVAAIALTGRRCHLVLGARTLPAAFHAWVVTAQGEHVGNAEAGGADHPWTPIYTTR